MSFGKTLMQIRKERNISQIDLAEQLGVTRQTISRWETGAACPSTEKLILLAQVLQVSLDTLTNGNTEVPYAEEPSKEKAEVQSLKVESASADPLPLKRLAIAACALLLVVAFCMGIFFIGARGQEDVVPIEKSESREVDISEWSAITLTPLEP